MSRRTMYWRHLIIIGPAPAHERQRETADRILGSVNAAKRPARQRNSRHGKPCRPTIDRVTLPMKVEKAHRIARALFSRRGA